MTLKQSSSTGLPNPPHLIRGTRSRQTPSFYLFLTYWLDKGNNHQSRCGLYLDAKVKVDILCHDVGQHKISIFFVSPTGKQQQMEVEKLISKGLFFSFFGTNIFLEPVLWVVRHVFK